MRLALIALALAALGGCASGALLLQRPEQDCINPSVKKVNEFNFFPEDYRSFISEPEPDSPTVNAKVGGLMRAARARVLGAAPQQQHKAQWERGGVVVQSFKNSGGKCAANLSTQHNAT
jgi:hypothetical protein